MQKQTGLFEDARKVEYAMKMGYSWFDLMYPRGSDAEARELKIGKYAKSELTQLIGQNYKEALQQNNPDKLSGKKRHMKN